MKTDPLIKALIIAQQDKIDALNTEITSLKETNQPSWRDSDIKAKNEEISRLKKDNFKLAERYRKLSSGNFDEFFTYASLPIKLSPGGTATTTITITNAADFYVTKLSRVGGDFAFLIKDSSNDRQWSNIPIHSQLGAGTAELPLILPKPRFIARGSTITIELTNLSPHSPTEVRLALVGYKVYHVADLKCPGTTTGPYLAKSKDFKPIGIKQVANKHDMDPMSVNAWPTAKKDLKALFGSSAANALQLDATATRNGRYL